MATNLYPIGLSSFQIHRANANKLDIIINLMNFPSNASRLITVDAAIYSNNSSLQKEHKHYQEALEDNDSLKICLDIDEIQKYANTMYIDISIKYSIGGDDQEPLRRRVEIPLLRNSDYLLSYRDEYYPECDSEFQSNSYYKRNACSYDLVHDIKSGLEALFISDEVIDLTCYFPAIKSFTGKRNRYPLVSVN